MPYFRRQSERERTLVLFSFMSLINPRRACAARVTVVAVSVCLCVCVCVCPISHISPLGLLFVLKTLLGTRQATKVKKFVAFFLKLRRSRATALPALYGYRAVRHFLSALYARALLKCHVDRGAELVSGRVLYKFRNFHASDVTMCVLLSC